MKTKILSLIAVATLLSTATSCIKEIDPQTNYATKEQVANAPGAFDNAVSAITATLAGQFVYAPSDTRANDFGLPAFYLMRDVSGQDIAYPYTNWFSGWYCADHLGPSWANSQYPWTYYYKWIKSCNEVISLAGEAPTEDMYNGLGIAYCMRAYYYLDLARMFAQKPYGVDKNSETVPIVTETTAVADLSNNPRATNQEIYAFILSDLDKAEQYLANYQRTDLLTPDATVAAGLKARCYLDMEDWANAQTYAKKAQAGYTLMTADQYTDHDLGFNSPNGAWMLACRYKSDDPNITKNDGDSSWGSHMCIEIDPVGSGCGYAANYGQPLCIDYHLYQTIPATDCRKDCYIDFAIDEMATREEKIEALSKYSAHPDWLLDGTGVAAHSNGYIYTVGGLPLKFRVAGGEEGRANQYIGWCAWVPMMRVEEMYLIEAEAAGMQNESTGIQLLTTFAKTRDANYEYGSHNEAYYNSSTSQFQNEVWWQRRIEFWGEGLATYDIKRLQKGIIRSYAGTNHADQYQWNVEKTPEWMNWCIVQTETNYNFACTNNPEPIPPSGNSAPYAW